MKIEDWMVLGFIGVVTAFAIFLLSLFASEVANYRLRKYLKQQLQQGLLADHVFFDDFLNLQKVVGLDQKQTYATLLSLKADVDFGSSTTRGIVKPRLDALIREFSIKEPFSDLPEGIKEPLIALRNNSEIAPSIDELANKLRIHIKKQSRSDFMMKATTYGSSIITIIAFAWGFSK